MAMRVIEYNELPDDLSSREAGFTARPVPVAPFGALDLCAVKSKPLTHGNGDVRREFVERASSFVLTVIAHGADPVGDSPIGRIRKVELVIHDAYALGPSKSLTAMSAVIALHYVDTELADEYLERAHVNSSDAWLRLRRDVDRMRQATQLDGDDADAIKRLLNL